jgi:hypothetical protein
MVLAARNERADDSPDKTQEEGKNPTSGALSGYITFTAGYRLFKDREICTALVHLSLSCVFQPTSLEDEYCVSSRI